MFGRFELLCVATVSSWLAGLAFQLATQPTRWWLVAVLGVVGVFAAPAIGMKCVTGLSDWADWESWGPRDFYPTALAIAVVVSFTLPVGVCWALRS